MSTGKSTKLSACSLHILRLFSRLSFINHFQVNRSAATTADHKLGAIDAG